jgi:hypothetical protein
MKSFLVAISAILAIASSGAVHQTPLKDWRPDITKPLTGEAALTPEDYFSDLDEGVQFTDQSILSWNPPHGWVHRDEIKSKGCLTFVPEKKSLQALYFKDAIIKMGQLKSVGHAWREADSVDHFARTSGTPARDLVILGQRDLSTRAGSKARIIYFARFADPYGAVATIDHGSFVHYYVMYGKSVAEKFGVHNGFGTFHRLVYRYRFSLMKDIMF